MPLGALIFLSPFSLTAVSTRTLTGHVPAGVDRLLPLNRLDPNKNLSLAIGLPLRNRVALTNLLKELYDPRSTEFRKYLTPAQFTELFGPTEQDYQAVADFAQAQGLTVTRRHANRVILDVEGSAADIEKAFHINLQVYQHPNEPRTFYAPSVEPTIESTVPILDISGLDNYSLPRPLVHNASVKPAASGPRPAGGSGPGGLYRGGDFRAAYAPGVAANGNGQAIGLLEFDTYYAADITSYESQSGLPNVPLTNVVVGTVGSPGGGNIEVALDIEVAMAMAPGVSRILVYEGGSSTAPNSILSAMANDNLAKQLSSSWTWTGSPSSDSIFQQMAAQGQSFFQASGDDGAYTGAIPQPADSPYITVVGGTTLSTSGPGGAWTSEKTWNWYNNGSGTNGTSGGISTTYSIPTWQQSVSMSGNQGSTTMRNIPDVALTADNIWVTYNNGSSGGVGGTSCAAPLWAGFTALINQQAAGNGGQPVGFLNPALYSIASGAGYSTAFHDITSGNNTNPASPTKFSATTGYDLCTGLGTPAGASLINALAGAATPQVVSNSLALTIESCSNNAVDPGETVTMNFGLINTGSASTTNLVATLQATGGVVSPSGPQTFGALPAAGAAVTRPFSFTANGACGGIINASLQLQDGAANLGTVNFAIRLGAVTPTTSFSQAFDSVSTPALPSGWTTAVASGLQSTWATTTATFDTSPNSVFAPDTGNAAQTELVTPVISINSASAQLTFRQNYNLAMRTTSHPRATNYYNGGVLEISIGGGAFTDIISAGGSFIAGGYNCTLANGTANPLGGTQAWGGTSGGWITTTVALPASAAGQNIQLKWALASGVNTSQAVGWYVDSISLQDNFYSCCTPSADVGATQSASPNPGSVGQNLVYTLKISNTGPSSAANVTVTDSLPANVTFVSGSPGCINLGGSVACTIGALASGASSNLLVTVQPTAAGTLTNSVAVTTSTFDPVSTNNSSTATMAVYVPASVTAQPTNQVVIQGGNAAFYVGAGGSVPLTYQWTFAGTNLAGATASMLALSGAQPAQAGNYAAIVSNPSGSVTSAVATLTVLVPPAITAQPTNQTAVAGANAAFQVQANGTAPLSYQWTFSGANLASATTSALALTAIQTNQAGAYSVVVTNSAGSITSSVATLTVLLPPQITQQPASATVVTGTNVTFQSAATGSGPLNYQWFFNNAAIAGATSSSFARTNVQPGQAGNYLVVVTNSAGAATSAVAQLTVLVPPSISAQPTNQTAVVGANAAFQVQASGTAPLSYQWTFNGANLASATTSALGLTAIQTNQAGAYSVVVTNSAGSITSSVATLTVLLPPQITQQPTSATVVTGTNVTFQSAATGSGPLNYQWFFNNAAIAGATASSLAQPNVQPNESGNYLVVVTNSAGAATSAVAQLTVLVPPSISAQPTNQTILAGATAQFAIGATGTAPLSYQWWFNGSNGVGSNANTLSLTNAQPGQSGAYTVVVTNSAGSVTSQVALLTVGTPPSISQQPSGQVVAQGQSATFQFTAAGDSPIAYQWRFNGAGIAGATSQSFTIANALTANAGSYDAVASNPYGAATTSVAQLTVLVPPAITAQPTNQDVAMGGDASFQVAATGSGPLSFQWWFNQTNAVGTNGNIMALSSVQPAVAGAYCVVISNSAGSITSVIASLTVGIPPSVSQQPSNLTVVQGQNATFSLAASGSNPFGYQWRFNGAPIAGATSSSFNLNAAAPSNVGGYDAVITNNYGSSTSLVAQLNVLVPPSIVAQPTNQIVLPGGSATFFATANGSAPLTYQWTFNGNALPGQTTTALSLGNIQPQQAGGYALTVTNNAGSITSSTATLRVLISPSITGSTNTPTGFSAVVSTISGLNYLLEYKNTLQDPAWSPAGTWQTATGGTLSLQDTNPPTASRFYRVRSQ